MGISSVWYRLRTDNAYAAKVDAWRTISKRTARSAAFSETLSTGRVQAPRSRGTDRLYWRQRQSFDLPEEGSNVVAVTRLASGNSPGCTEPILNRLPLRSRAPLA